MLTVYGHRGLPSKAPENTIASFKAASERRYKLVGVRCCNYKR